MPGRFSFCVMFALVLAMPGFSACSRESATPDGEVDGMRSRTVQVRAGAELVAELFFEENKLQRVEFKTKDQALRDKFQARLDTILEKAQREGLHMDFHEMWPGGVRAWLVTRPKPGEEYFTKGILWHLGDDTFTVSAK
ncbi:hypothetical protein [Chondromyces crocatus]|uniref:Lipoprotein n=1 Tax=Chondromyces crocatus TaxID=52 RepID=A0A0K1EAE6_CHOCO|nr:hypothetical protein [Chondromyces crocatus]AKT37845.1 uncharacterized protein CMC5_019880 [Chondromyces crocatus]